MKLRYLYFTALVITMKALTGCTLTIHPDGSRTYGLDPQASAAIIDEIGDK
jgi:hypothetical protein